MQAAQSGQKTECGFYVHTSSGEIFRRIWNERDGQNAKAFEKARNHFVQTLNFGESGQVREGERKTSS